jgi:hypothetical protein
MDVLGVYVDVLVTTGLFVCHHGVWLLWGPSYLLPDADVGDLSRVPSVSLSAMNVFNWLRTNNTGGTAVVFWLSDLVESKVGLPQHVLFSRTAVWELPCGRVVQPMEPVCFLDGRGHDIWDTYGEPSLEVLVLDEGTVMTLRGELQHADSNKPLPLLRVA